MHRIGSGQRGGVWPSFPRRRESRLDPGSESGVTVLFPQIRQKNWHLLLVKHSDFASMAGTRYRPSCASAAHVAMCKPFFVSAFSAFSAVNRWILRGINEVILRKALPDPGIEEPVYFLSLLHLKGLPGEIAAFLHAYGANQLLYHGNSQSIHG